MIEKDKQSNANDISKIMKRLDDITSKLDSKLHISIDDSFLDNQEFIQVMNISKRTAQEWRNSHLIGYTQVGKKVYYKVSDIKALLEKYYIPAI